MEVTHESIVSLREEMGDIKEKVNELYYALIGNKVTMDGGLVRRMEESEKEIRSLRKRVDELSVTNVRLAKYEKIIWGCVGAVASGIFLEIMHSVFRSVTKLP